MRHWLLRVALVLAAILDNRTPMPFAMPTSHSGIESLVRVVSQRQERGPQAVSRSPAGRLSPSIIPSAIGKRSRIRIQELSPSLLLHYYVFTSFVPSWLTVSWFSEFWFQLATQVSDISDDFFLEETIQFNLGPLSLEFLDASGGTQGIPREFVFAFATAMMSYTQRGFCGTFNARIISRGPGVEESARVKLWISLRIVA